MTDKEVFAIEAKMSEDSAHEMLAAIKKATDKPLTTIIITHSDGDHVNGLVGFPRASISLPIPIPANTWKQLFRRRSTPYSRT